MNQEENAGLSIRINLSRKQIIEFFNNFVEMFHDTDVPYEAVDDTLSPELPGKENLGYAYVAVDKKGHRHVTMSEQHKEDFINSIEYYLDNNPQVVINEMQKIIDAKGQSFDILENAMDFAGEDILLQIAKTIKDNNEARAKGPSVKM